MRHSEAAAAIGISPATLRRWLRLGLVPEYQGQWTAAAVGKGRLIVRLRDRGYTLAQLRSATQDGRLAFGQVLELLDASATHDRRRARRATGLDRAVVEQVAAILGLAAGEPLTDDDLRLLRYVADALARGLPLEAMLQLTRVYAQAIAQIADAEVRLIHLYVHEPLMRAGGSADDVAGELYTLAGDLLPLAAPLFESLHRRLLAHFVDQDVIGHMEADQDDAQSDEVGRMRVAIAFADLAGFTELTEAAGDLQAADTVERFLEDVTSTLPADARVLKTIGDGVMVVGSDPVALTGWAVSLQQNWRRTPRPRIAVHRGYALYREGDYYGREVNRAARVAAIAGEGEVLVTGPVAEASGAELEFEALEPVSLKGIAQATELFRATGATSETGAARAAGATRPRSS